jgi:mono/diheme cytochrome c family protein
MRTRMLIALLVGALALACTPQRPMAQPGGAGSDWWGRGWMGPGHMWPDGDLNDDWGWNQMGPGQLQRAERHWTYMNNGVPAAYSGARSTVRATRETLTSGARLYGDNCARCHGAKGFGDGEEGRGLVPSPALIRYFVQMPMSGDEYLLWTISEGGERFGTDMPAFKDKLSEDDIWKIVAYMRPGFPEVTKAQ